MVHIKDPLMLLSKGNPGSGSSMSSLTLIAIFPMTENHKKLIFLFDFMELSHSLKGLPIELTAHKHGHPHSMREGLHVSMTYSEGTLIA